MRMGKSNYLSSPWWNGALYRALIVVVIGSTGAALRIVHMAPIIHKELQGQHDTQAESNLKTSGYEIAIGRHSSQLGRTSAK